MGLGFWVWGLGFRVLASKRISGVGLEPGIWTRLGEVRKASVFGPLYTCVCR